MMAACPAAKLASCSIPRKSLHISDRMLSPRSEGGSEPPPPSIAPAGSALPLGAFLFLYVC